MKEIQPIELDGRTGEGGGQIVRIACALSSVVGQAVRINHVRGNREGARGGGLKAQHVASISWLAKATGAETAGLSVGSQYLEFRPRLRPFNLEARKVSIAADSAAASSLLVFQAILPFLLFAGNGKGEPIRVDITGGTNVSWAPSYEYLDQVLLPMLEQFFGGFRVERKLKGRGWSLGKVQRGTIAFTIHPLKPGEPIKVRQPYPTEYTEGDLETVDLDCSIIAPTDMHESLCDALVQDLGDLFPGVDVDFKMLEDSGSDARVYVLLVARSAAGHRWGRDMLTSVPRKQSKSTPKTHGKKGNSNIGGASSCMGGAKATVSVSQSIARKVSKELFAEVSNGGVVDEFLQDQLVIFQTLAEGFSSFPGPRSALCPPEAIGNNGGSTASGKDDLARPVAHLNVNKTLNTEFALRRDNAGQPFGQGSDHTKTARWVASMLLPQLNFYNQGLVCEGIGISMQRPLGQDPNA